MGAFPTSENKAPNATRSKSTSHSQARLAFHRQQHTASRLSIPLPAHARPLRLNYNHLAGASQAGPRALRRIFPLFL